MHIPVNARFLYEGVVYPEIIAIHTPNLTRIVTSNIGQLISSVSTKLEIGNFKLQHNVATASTINSTCLGGIFLLHH